jgi:hypothetical protein
LEKGTPRKEFKGITGKEAEKKSMGEG